MILIHFEFFGSDEELEILDNSWKEMAKASEGVEYEGKYIPLQGRYHFTTLFKVDSLHAWEKSSANWNYQRDKKKLTRASVEFYNVV
jgi:hypothetical protein